jgi:quercetin dioxygenase-like cupin family protein
VSRATLPRAMKRHPSLIPLSHDHHHALVEARRLRRAAEASDDERRAAVAEFLRFFSAETIRHFRTEEELVFPLLVGQDGDGSELLVRALLEHQRIHALAARIERAPRSADMRELGELLEAHVRLEERRLFPLIEEIASEHALRELDLPRPVDQASPVVDLLTARGTGPLWGAETQDLNATLLAWPAGGGPGDHVNDECDVLLLVLAGSATVFLDAMPHTMQAGDAMVLERGKRRSVSAGPSGVRYVTVHRRRGPLQIARLGSPVGELDAEPEDE